MEANVPGAGSGVTTTGQRTGRSVAALDGALERVSALEFQPPAYFVSHAPMACEALDALGLGGVIASWVPRFEASLGPAARATTPPWRGDFDWLGAFGDRRLLGQWVGYFERGIADAGWSTTVELWVPRLMPGLVGALFHGVIRTSHAVRALTTADTPARRSELARALGNWATWFQAGAPVDKVRNIEDAASAATEAAAEGALCYVTAPTIFNLHGVTGAMAVELLAGHLAPADAAAAVVQLRAEHRSLYRDLERSTPVADATAWDDRLEILAAESYDAHQVKLVEACRRGFGRAPGAGFVMAARTAVGWGEL